MSGNKVYVYCAHLPGGGRVYPSKQAEYERYKEDEAEFIRRVERAPGHRYVRVRPEEYKRVRRMSYNEFNQWLGEYVRSILMLVSRAEDNPLHDLHNVIVIEEWIEKLVPPIPEDYLPAKKINL
jgi:hypothetical protein